MEGQNNNNNNTKTVSTSSGSLGSSSPTKQAGTSRLTGYVGRDARILRSRRFQLERSKHAYERAGGSGRENDATGSSSLGAAALQQLSFLYAVVADASKKAGAAGGGGGEEVGSVSTMDMHTKPFRIEAQQALLCHHKSTVGHKLRSVRDRLANTLKVNDWLADDQSWPTDRDVDDECDRHEGSEYTYLEQVFTQKELEKLLDSEVAWSKEHPLQELVKADSPSSYRDTQESPTSVAVAPFTAKRKNSEREESPKSTGQEVENAKRQEVKRLDRKIERGELNHQVGNWQSSYAAYKKGSSKMDEPYRKLAPAAHAPSAGGGGLDGEKKEGSENEPPQGAAMFTSAKQALWTKNSDPSKNTNYSHTIESMSEEKKQLLGWNNPNMYKRRGMSNMSNRNTNTSATTTKGGFVPPYVKKALEATTGGGNNGNGSKRGGGFGGGAGGAGMRGGENGEDAEPPFSPKVMELLLQHSPDGCELPEAILKLDAQLLEGICNDIMEKTGIGWGDIVGQEDAKRLVQEMVVWPMLNPNLFKGVRTPPKGLLLFGPPGTGKTLIGKAIASNIKATFFNISASSLTSKWIGEGEKMVRTLFTLAGFLQPAVIFIDEIDSILSARKSDGEHEASRRLKTEMLVQIEGCDPNCSERRVLIVGATNRPEELDEAARRRMPKQLYIPLPCERARRIMIEKGISQVKYDLSETDLSKIVSKTHGYSGSDMKNFIQEACQGPVRDALSNAKGEADVANLSEQDLRAVVIKDFAVASRAQRATVSEEEIKRYALYNARHGTSYNEGDGEDDDEW